VLAGVTAGTAAAALAVAAPAAPAAATRAASAPTAYVVVRGGIVPVNTATHHAEPMIRLKGQASFMLVAAPDGQTIYGADAGGVTPDSTVTRTAGPRITFHSVRDIALTPNGRALYVAAGRLRIYRVPTATDRPGPPIRTATNAFAVVVAPGGATVYAAGGYGRGSGGRVGEVTPVSTATSRAGHKPWSLGLTPNGKILYAADLGSDTVVPITTATGRAGRPITVPRTPVQVAVAPDGRTAFVVSDPSDGLHGWVTPVRVATGTTGKPVRVSLFLGTLTFAPGGRTAWLPEVVNQDIVPISTATGRAGRPIRLPGYPTSIAFTPSGKTAFVGLQAGLDTYVVPVNLVTRKYSDPIPVGPDFSNLVGPILIIP
jgi:DNA-binding beta-propeller fold protein YncE